MSRNNPYQSLILRLISGAESGVLLVVLWAIQTLHAPLYAQTVKAGEFSYEQPSPSIGPENRLSFMGKSALQGSDESQTAGQSAAANSALQTIEIDKRFEGFGFADNPAENFGFLFIPPDPIGAAGPDLVIAVVNDMIEARTKTSGALRWREGLNTFLGNGVGGLLPSRFGVPVFDPKIVYDQFEDRFVVVAMELTDLAFGDPANNARILLAVSKSSSPKKATPQHWFFHAIPAKLFFDGFSHWADYPGFEVDEEAVYITANMFRFFSAPSGPLFGGVRLWIVDKHGGGDWYNSGATPPTTVHNPYRSSDFEATTMPAQVFGSTGVGPSVGTFLVLYSGISKGQSNFVQVTRVDDPLGSSGGPFFVRELVNVGSIDNTLSGLPSAPQLGSSVGIEVNDRRALDAVWRDNALWLVATVLPSSGTDAGETTAHWFKLNTSQALSGGAIVLDDQGNIGGEDIAPGTFTFFPAVAVNSAGDAQFGFSASAPTIYAGAFVTGRRNGDTPGAVRPSATVKAGEDFYVRTFGAPSNRWGDYSGIALDPEDDTVFWVFNEFADQRGITIIGEDGVWGTAWASAFFQDGAAKTTAPLVATFEENDSGSEAHPTHFALQQNYPNPFNPETGIRFALPEDGQVVLKIFNTSGQMIRMLTNAHYGAGHHTVRWDGKDTQGNLVSSGVYLYHIRAGDFSQFKKMTLLR